VEKTTGGQKNFDYYMGTSLRVLSVGCFVLISFLMVFNVFIRFFPIMSLEWFDEVLEALFAWMVFLGTAALWRENEHFAVTFLPDWLKGTKKGCILEVVLNLASILFLAVFTYYSLNLTMRAGDTTPVLKLSKKLWYMCMPLSGAIMIGYSLRNMVSSVCRLGK